MFALQASSSLARNSRASIARAAAAALLAALGGCASTDNQTDYSGAGAQTRVAHATTEIEADGLPEQTPPSHRIRTIPDDPSEPFSRNYGGVNPSATVAPLVDEKPQNRPEPKLPHDLPADFRKKSIAALDVSD